MRRGKTPGKEEISTVIDKIEVINRELSKHVYACLLKINVSKWGGGGSLWSILNAVYLKERRKKKN